jgi:hypothetical protein
MQRIGMPCPTESSMRIGFFLLGQSSFFVSYETTLHISYLTNSTRYTSYKSNWSERKNSTGFKSYRNPEGILWIKWGLRSRPGPLALELGCVDQRVRLCNGYPWINIHLSLARFLLMAATSKNPWIKLHTHTKWGWYLQYVVLWIKSPYIVIKKS